MTASKSTPARKTQRPARNDMQSRHEDRLAPPDRQLWETDKARAFEAGVRWFLAVSRTA
jgi:hypothetical protein